MKKLFIIFTEIFKPQPKIKYSSQDLSLDINISVCNVRGLKSSIKHYSGMASIKGIDRHVKCVYLKLVEKAEAKLPIALTELSGQLETLKSNRL